MSRFSRILDLVAEHSGVPVSDLKSARQDRRTVRPRQVACWLARRHTPYSLSVIARHLGGRDHSTIVYSINQIEGMKERPEVASLIRAVEAQLPEEQQA